ncbi:MAG: hypothetical protein JSW13_00420 [Candidatus Aerophobus sp.]|nr:MAG: hypothetical protein JSW13_00420 [Candidatus Aerophobus sp.]
MLLLVTGLMAWCRSEEKVLENSREFLELLNN